VTRYKATTEEEKRSIYLWEQGQRKINGGEAGFQGRNGRKGAGHAGGPVSLRTPGPAAKAVQCASTAEVRGFQKNSWKSIKRGDGEVDTPSLQDSFSGWEKAGTPGGEYAQKTSSEEAD